jgi:hypothetical protein
MATETKKYLDLDGLKHLLTKSTLPSPLNLRIDIELSARLNAFVKFKIKLIDSVRCKLNILFHFNSFYVYNHKNMAISRLINLY